VSSCEPLVGHIYHPRAQGFKIRALQHRTCTTAQRLRRPCSEQADGLPQLHDCHGSVRARTDGSLVEWILQYFCAKRNAQNDATTQARKAEIIGTCSWPPCACTFR
jgi:hypothetical protein